MNSSRSFEERVFDRFDAVDERFERIEGRLVNVEIKIGKLEARQYDTKPIWEQALAAIADTNERMRQGFDEIRGELAKINARLDKILRADQRYVDSRLEKIESQGKPS